MPDRLGTERAPIVGGLDEALLRLAIDEHERCVKARLQRLWLYFRNPSEPVGAAGRERLAQERALPARITGRDHADGGLDDRARGRREVVIENDIAWRVQTMVDFLLSRPVRIASQARDEGLRREIERTLDAVWEGSGGLAMLQDAALLGHVYGHVDLAVRIDEEALRAARGGDPVIAADAVRMEPIEPTRGIPVVSAGDYRRLDGYIVHVERELNEVEGGAGAPSGRRGRLFGRGSRGSRPGGPGHPRRRRSCVTEVFTPGLWRLYEDGVPVAARRSGLLPGVVPVVHIQNVSQPFRYTGLSEVEALIPLQDELNTRLSDRASRVTMQSFKMYLARNLDGFERMPVGPGVVWSTDHPDASIEAFGADADSPSERAHIEEIREALDKISAVPPLAGGVVRAKVGNLSSANALRITLMSLLAKTARKRVTYGNGLERASRMVLDALDGAGVLPTAPGDRGVRVLWPDALPADPSAELDAARAKADLGVPAERVLGELGYSHADTGID